MKHILMAKSNFRPERVHVISLLLKYIQANGDHFNIKCMLSIAELGKKETYSYGFRTQYSTICTSLFLIGVHLDFLYFSYFNAHYTHTLTSVEWMDIICIVVYYATCIWNRVIQTLLLSVFIWNSWMEL